MNQGSTFSSTTHEAFVHSAMAKFETNAKVRKRYGGKTHCNKSSKCRKGKIEMSKLSVVKIALRPTK